MKTPCLHLHDVQSARALLAGSIRRTPCHSAPGLSAATGMAIRLKREDLQRTGAFKERGARNALAALSAAQRSRGVVAASAGNHALGLAYHGALLSVPVTVVMPETAPEVKRTRCRGLGAAVVLHGRTFEEAETFARAFAQEHRATYVHPFDDPAVIAGQGTLALEVLEQVPDADTLVLPVGGGGLLAGCAVAAKALRPSLRVVAVEPENAACFLAACVSGAPRAAALAPTLAGGLCVRRAGERAFALAAPLVDDVVTVSETEIACAVAALARKGVVAEGAGATALAAVLAGKVRGRLAVLPITGRNIDPRRHEQVLADADLDEVSRSAPRWARAA